ncbi:MAG: hypothetical protein WDO16_15895 [Bacteroidota bacterium]
MNLNADVLSFFIGAYGLFSLGTNNSLINMPDTIDRTDVEARIYGLSLSAGGLAGSNYIKGVSINGEYVPLLKCMAWSLPVHRM